MQGQPRFLIYVWLFAMATAALAQDKPLERKFSVGAPSGYRVRMVVRSEVTGQRPTQIGANASAEPFSRFAECVLAWEATRRIISVAPDGTAEIEEILALHRR
jgi:hypothetical protein